MTIFAAPGQDGQALAREVERVGRASGFEPTVAAKLEPMAYFEAALCDDVVVVDVSLEEGREDVYQAVSVLPSLLDHVLIVSRTYLPLNFVPARPGGTPKYPYPDSLGPWLPEMSGEPPTTWSNPEILAWLGDQLATVRLPPESRRLTRDELARLGEDPSPMREIYEEADRRREKAAPSQVFLSYRGVYYAEVKALARRIADGGVAGVEPKPVRVIEPREFALEREYLSEGRRWMVMGFLDDELRDCDELLVYDTDDYLGSWWTLGELAAAAYINQAGNTPTGATRTIRIRSYDRRTETLSDGDRYRMNLTEDQLRRMARFLSNTRPDTMGPESRFPMKAQRWIFRLGLGRFYLRAMCRMLSDPRMEGMFSTLPQEAGGAEDLRMDLEERFSDVRSYRDYLWDRVHLDAFWDDLCLDKAPVGPGYPVDANVFFAAPHDRMIHVAKATVKRAAGPGRPFSVPTSDGARKVVELPPRYLWHPPRLGGMIGGKLEPLGTFLSVD